MPLWDSVHRGLEKASQEAAAVAVNLSEQETIRAEQPGAFLAPTSDEALSFPTPEGEKEV